MLKLRTKLLLFAIAVFGVGIGVMSPIADGAYSAICLFVLPVLVALAGASIIADFGRNAAKTEFPARQESRIAESPAATKITASLDKTRFAGV